MFMRCHSSLLLHLHRELQTQTASILREQILQIRRREAARETFLAQHVGDRLRLALLQFPNFFLDRAGRNEPVGVYGLRLADAMRTVNRLRLHRRAQRSGLGLERQHLPRQV